jgi:uncharacterized protein YndB with AHSA1/START domain
MPDMLVKLYTLPDPAPFIARAQAAGVTVRRAIAPEKHVVVGWVLEAFGSIWASECEVAFSNHPPSCFIAVEGSNLLGFACHEATCKNFFGPTGVHESARGKGIGAAVVLVHVLSLAARADDWPQWLGPRRPEMVIDHWDCRTGGSYRYLHVSDGNEYGFHGCFHEVRPNEVIVQTFMFEGVPDHVALERLTLHDLPGGRCRLVATSLVDSFEARDAFVSSGMEEGVIADMLAHGGREEALPSHAAE